MLNDPVAEDIPLHACPLSAWYRSTAGPWLTKESKRLQKSLMTPALHTIHSIECHDISVVVRGVCKQAGSCVF